MRHRSRRYRLRIVLTSRGAGTIAAAFALCGYLATHSRSPNRVRIVWYASASATVGLYIVRHDRAFVRGDLVLFIPTSKVAKFAAQRGYLPAGVPLVKLPWLSILFARKETTYLLTANLWPRDSHRQQGAVAPAWSGCRTLDQSEVFLLMEGIRSSFDGRYFGTTNVSRIVGRLDPIWTR